MEALEAEITRLSPVKGNLSRIPASHLVKKEHFSLKKERNMVNWTKVYIPLLVEVEIKCMKAPIFSFLLLPASMLVHL